jgi:hypothetical protein
LDTCLVANAREASSYRDSAAVDGGDIFVAGLSHCDGVYFYVFVLFWPPETVDGVLDLNANCCFPDMIELLAFGVFSLSITDTMSISI